MKFLNFSGRMSRLEFLKASVFFNLIFFVCFGIATICFLKIVGIDFNTLTDANQAQRFIQNLSEGGTNVEHTKDWKLAIIGFFLTFPIFVYLGIEAMAVAVCRIRDINFSLHPAFVLLIAFVITTLITTISPFSGSILSFGWGVFVYAAPTNFMKVEKNDSNQKSNQKNSTFDSSEFKKLHQMRIDGILTEEEFSHAKAKILKDAA